MKGEKTCLSLYHFLQSFLINNFSGQIVKWCSQDFFIFHLDKKNNTHGYIEAAGCIAGVCFFHVRVHDRVEGPGSKSGEDLRIRMSCCRVDGFQTVATFGLVFSLQFSVWISNGIIW
jgi:hypothetical protein